MIAWRNGPPQVLVSVETPITTLLAPTRRNIPITPLGLPALVLADSGNLYWIDRADQNYVRKTVVSSASTTLLGQSPDTVDTVRLIAGIPVWTSRGETDTVLSSPLGLAACFIGTNSSVEYDVRDNAPSLWVYSDGTQLHAQTPTGAPANARRRAVKH